MMRRTPMKRTGFARKGFTGNTERTLALVPIRVPAPSAPIFHQAEKLAPLRSEPYRRYVASFACFGCGLVGSSQCAHANEGKGMAMKVCDRRTFPLCFPCHSNLDNTRGMTRDQRRQLETEYVDRMQAQARADRRPEFKEEKA
jgi:hypothetical protein